MASLRSMILDNRFVSVAPLLDGADQFQMMYAADQFEMIFANKILDALRSKETVLVDANSVSRDLTEALNQQRVTDFAVHGIPCPKPPFHQMWLECRPEERPYGPAMRSGSLVNRVDVHPQESPIEAFDRFGSPWPEIAGWKKDFPEFRKIEDQQPSTLVMAQFWHDDAPKRATFFAGAEIYWLDQNGNFLDYLSLLWPPPKSAADISREEKCTRRVFLAWVLHTFARLNCHNVQLVPMKAGMPSHKHKHRAPSTVWHEIVVEQIQVKTKGNTTPSGEKQELRFHRVRGHYADYTKGAGLFGKYKVRIWVEEHARGNPELGEVVASYTVQ